MKANLFLFIITCVLLTACGAEKQDQSFSHADMDLIQKRFEEKQVPVLLSGLQTPDQEKLALYGSRMKILGDTLTRQWNIEPNKLVIKSYLQLAGLKEEYRSFSFKEGKLQTLPGAPQHIKDSFNKRFVCYSPEYWKPFAIKRSVSFSWDTLQTKMVVSVIQVH